MRRENPFFNILFNIVIPSVILIKFSSPDYLGPVRGLCTALLFPILYGVADFFKRDKVNVISVIGLVSICLTGGIGLLELDAQWLAVKEALVPFVIGVMVLASVRSPFPFVQKLLYEMIDRERVEECLKKNNAVQVFRRHVSVGSVLIALSFLVSSILNFALAKWIVVSEAGTPAFNEELGRMTALSFPVIALPSSVLSLVAIFYMVRHLQQLTGLEVEDIFLLRRDKK